MNLFVGVLFSNFMDVITKEEKKEIQNNMEAQQYLDFLMQIDTVKPEFSAFKPKTGKIKQLFSKITESSWFDNCIMIVIIMNLIILAIEFEGSSDNYSNFLKIFNYIFTAIFILESILKLLANGIIRYFYFGWNKFDMFVVITSIIDLIVANAFNSNVTFIKSFQIIRVLRVMRVTR